MPQAAAVRLRVLPCYCRYAHAKVSRRERRHLRRREQRVETFSAAMPAGCYFRLRRDGHQSAGHAGKVLRGEQICCTVKHRMTSQGVGELWIIPFNRNNSKTPRSRSPGARGTTFGREGTRRVVHRALEADTAPPRWRRDVQTLRGLSFGEPSA